MTEVYEQTRTERHEKETYNTHVEATLFEVPHDIGEGHIGYNPSNIIETEIEIEGVPTKLEVMWFRVEQDKSDENSSHIGNTISRPYVVGDEATLTPLTEVTDREPRLYDRRGEDPSFTKIVDIDGQEKNLVGIVQVDADPVEKNKVTSLRTVFYMGTSLDNLMEIGRGPEWMKDIRVVQDPATRELHFIGRPDNVDLENPAVAHRALTIASSGDIRNLNDAVIQENLRSNFIDRSLYAAHEWGGANDGFMYDSRHLVLLSHRAENRGENGERKLHYRAELNIYDIESKQITSIPLVMPEQVYASVEAGSVTAKEDSNTDLKNVVFPGGVVERHISRDEVTFMITAGFADSRAIVCEATLDVKSREAFLQSIGYTE